MTTAAEIAEALGAKRNGTGWVGRCIAHEDEHPSLSIAEADDGKPLVKCHAGCTQEALIAALQARGLWSISSDGLTVAELATAKHLPESLLRESGFHDDEQRGHAVVRIEYRDAAGKIICTRYRGSLGANGSGPRFWFRRGNKQQLFGIWRLRANENVIVVEGETDTLALWDAGFNAIGVPGADAWRDDRFAAALAKCPLIYVHIEPDIGGPKFRAAFERSTLREKVRFFTVAPAAKDPCELRARDPGGFRAAIDAALARAEPAGAAQAAESHRMSSRPRCDEPGNAAPILRIASSITPRELEPLWPGVLWIGKPTMSVGDPGLGKSLVTVDIAARVSRGMPWPCESTERPPGGVLMLSAEDDPEDTIVPRLAAAGADLDRITFLEGVRQLDDNGKEHDLALALDLHVDAVRSAIRPDTRLLIVDPISAFLGRADSHNNAEIRAVLASLGRLASEKRFALLAVSHLNKVSGANAVYRVTGSLAFVAAARAVFAIARDPDDHDRRLMLPIKSNLGPDTSGYSYTISTADNDVPYVRWSDERVTRTAEEVLTSTPSPREQAIIERGSDVRDWLREQLAREPRSASSMWHDAERHGFSRRDVERAKRSLGVTAEPMGYRGAWHWRLPRTES